MRASAAGKLMSTEVSGADYGIYLLSVPVVASVCLLIVALAAHSIAGFIWVLVLTALITAGFAAGEIFQSPKAWESGSPLKPMFGWLGFVAVLWPLGYPAYLRERRRYHLGNWLIGAVIIEILFVAGAILAAVIIATGYGKLSPQQQAAERQKNPVPLTADPRWMPDADDLRLVKSAYLDNCQHKTVEQEVNGFFASPRWEAGATSDGRDFVNVNGVVTYQGKSATAVFQFLMDKDKRGFKYHAFTINGVPQSIYVAAWTLTQMCAS
ncbi:MAG: hypothetical protein WCC11_04105 [Gammaproteobacteria bacterium]